MGSRMIHDSRRRRCDVAVEDPSRKWVMRRGVKGVEDRSAARSAEMVRRGVGWRGSSDIYCAALIWCFDMMCWLRVMCGPRGPP